MATRAREPSCVDSEGDAAGNELPVHIAWFVMRAAANRGSLALRAGKLADAERDVIIARALALDLGTALYATRMQGCLGEIRAQTALELSISPKSVEQSLTWIYRKLGLASRTRLAGYVVTHGVDSFR
jgi:hypothetical protein